eukprot:CAMPEP_0197918130 /NCGR_PEP_ID=MMETSP1439-20131203/84923_1 /TAXON_ID=66791 /ORGANISM="Gonyaulax spinifera, Strain CCMP409" /LENGTH=37 /DNA_ID= /DNA_START= /DNA_END= /DNA_ORIENTATION=
MPLHLTTSCIYTMGARQLPSRRPDGSRPKATAVRACV